MIKASMANKAIGLLLLVLIAKHSLLAQAKKDSSMLDYSRPGKYHQLLADLTGEWTFKGRHFSGHPNPDSNKVVMEFGGRLVRKPIMNDRFFLAELTGGKSQIPVQDGKMIEDTVRDMMTEGYDNVKRKFVQTFINNHIGSCIIYYEGNYDPATKTIFYESEVEGLPGKKRKRYQHFIFHDNNHYTVEYYWERDGKKIKSNESILTRVGENVATPLSPTEKQKARLDYMTPGPMHQLLASLNGEWEGDVTFWPVPGAPPVKGKSSVVNKMLYDGLFQEGTHTGTGMEKPYETKLIWGYDNIKKKFFILAIDNMGSGFGQLEGSYDTASKVFNLVLRKMDPATGEENVFREVRKIVNTDRQEMKMYATDKKTGKEYQSLEIIYTRKK